MKWEEVNQDSRDLRGNSGPGGIPTTACVWPPAAVRRTLTRNDATLPTWRHSATAHEVARPAYVERHALSHCDVYWKQQLRLHVRFTE